MLETIYEVISKWSVTIGNGTVINQIQQSTPYWCTPAGNTLVNILICISITMTLVLLSYFNWHDIHLNKQTKQGIIGGLFMATIELILIATIVIIYLKFC